MSKPRVLLVGDERPSGGDVRTHLRARGFDVVPAQHGRQALQFMGENVFDLILLDLGRPGAEGLHLCQALRQGSCVPIIVLAGPGHEADKVRALDLGADDCLTQPFGLEELLARVRAVLRRSRRPETGPRMAVHTPDLTVDFGRRRVLAGGKDVPLTPTEYRLLQELVIHAGQVLTHTHLLQAVWGPEYCDQTGYLWTYIRRLRRKLERDPHQPHYLLTQPGVGYRLMMD